MKTPLDEFLDKFALPPATGETQKHLAGGKFNHDQTSHGMRYGGDRASSTRVFQSLSTAQQAKFIAGLEKRGKNREADFFKPYHKARLEGRSPQIKLDKKNPYKGSPQDKRQQAVQNRRNKKAGLEAVRRNLTRVRGEKDAQATVDILTGKKKANNPSQFATLLKTMAEGWADKGHITPGEFSGLLDFLDGLK